MRFRHLLVLLTLLACGGATPVTNVTPLVTAPPAPPPVVTARFGAQRTVENYPVRYPALPKEEIASRVAAFRAKNPGFDSVTFGDDGFLKLAQLSVPTPQDKSSITPRFLASTYAHFFDDNAALLGLDQPGIEVSGPVTEPRTAIQKWGKYQVARAAISWSLVSHDANREYPAMVYLSGHAWPGLPAPPAEMSDHDLIAPLLALPVRVTLNYEVQQHPCDPVHSASDCPQAMTPPPAPPPQTRKLQPSEVTIGRRAALFHTDGASELRILALIDIRIQPPESPPFPGEGLMTMPTFAFEDGFAAPRWLDAVTGEDLSPRLYE